MKVHFRLSHTISMSEASASPDGGDISPTKRAFVDSFFGPDNHPSSDTICKDSCQLCCGGCFSGSEFYACTKRIKKHSRGQVCLVHHSYSKCVSCSAVVHSGCFVKSTRGYYEPQAHVPWKCIECTLAPSPSSETATVSKAVSNTASEAITATVVTDNDTFTSVAIFNSRQDLFRHMRDFKWRCRAGGAAATAHRLYFNCCVDRCAVTFGAKALNHNNPEDGEWSVKNMPTAHACFQSTKLVVGTALTTHTSNLPLNVFKDIQRLSCCKSFLTPSIQRYLQSTYNGILVDTKLIYNIGYRARRKLGVSEIERLVEQQKVSMSIHRSSTAVYTSA